MTFGQTRVSSRPRLVIDVDEETRRTIKSEAALKGISVTEYLTMLIERRDQPGEKR